MISDSSRSGGTEVPGRERRRHPRAAADWPLTLELESGACQGRVRDVSRAGVCFYLDRPVPVWTVLGLRLELPAPGGVRRVAGTGAVVRCEAISDHVAHYEVAVFLHDMPEPDREALEAYVAANDADAPAR